MNPTLKRLQVFWPVALPVAVVAFVLVSAFRSEQVQTAQRPRRAGEAEVKAESDGGGRTVATLAQARRVKLTDPHRAFQILADIKSESPDYIPARKEMAAWLLEVDQQAEAAEILDELVVIAPEDIKLRRALIEIYFDLQEYGTALPHAQTWARLKPEALESHIVLAEIYAELKRPADMVSPLSRALALAPQSWDVNALLAYAYVEMGDPQSAEKHVNWCLQQRPDDVISLRHKATLLRAAGEIEKATAQIRKAIAVAPEDVESRILECDLLLFQRQAEAAFASLAPFYDQNDSNREFLGAFFRAARLSGNNAQALAAKNRLQELISRDDAAVTSGK